ncbi:39S ribosomal protein L47, mitochondrial [Seminavis robusta]|uniref:Large ribosomal subunit protein uL29m n=1 Tax=Seminavis robusta TaxID=568900 RepID=A0A9N8H8P9_9STRA|nr:39S ribosomal protein L47, mitochondrial [Seminavis robusta]|eukprot:Sro226_g092030.1 39S ribosomal protein L47, mitochondrial (154) ;mRNA; r:35078-35539
MIVGRLLVQRSAVVGVRSLASSAVPSTSVVDTSTLLDQFRDSLSLEERREQPVGRSWHARELRRKSFDDLHKLWFVLYKEKNALLTERQMCRRNQIEFPQPERFRKAQKSMGAIKQVLGERKRERIAAFHESKALEEEDRLEEDMESEEHQKA